MEIIDELEGEARGIYSGAIGYLGLGGGCDLSVAIRAIVLDGEGAATIGVGGAIVIGSDPEAEFEETLLKGWAPMRALDPALPPGQEGLAKPAPASGGGGHGAVRRPQSAK
jgi:para-aminobenzoate synthetase